MHSHLGVKLLSCLLITHPFSLSLSALLFLFLLFSPIPSLCAVVFSQPTCAPSWSRATLPSASTRPFPRTLCSGLLLPSRGRHRELQPDMAMDPFLKASFQVKTIVRKTVGWTLMHIVIWECHQLSDTGWWWPLTLNL